MVARDHRAIFDYIRAGDPAGACEAMQAHLTNVKLPDASSRLARIEWRLELTARCPSEGAAPARHHHESAARVWAIHVPCLSDGPCRRSRGSAPAAIASATS